MSSPAANSLTRREPRAQTTTTRASLLLREAPPTRTACLSRTDCPPRAGLMRSPIDTGDEVWWHRLRSLTLFPRNCDSYCAPVVAGAGMMGDDWDSGR